MFKDRCPSQEVPNTDVCKQISDVFFKLAEAHKAYSEAAQGLAELASSVTPEQYTMLLVASVMPTIQVVVPGQLIGPLSPPQIHQTETSTAIGSAELIKYTKFRVLPDPYSSELSEASKNSATRVLAAAVFLKIKKLYFDDITSRMDASRLFGCKVSQLTKAITGIDYKSGPHHYVPKRQRETVMAKRKQNHNQNCLQQRSRNNLLHQVSSQTTQYLVQTLCQPTQVAVSYPKAYNSFLLYSSHTVFI